MLPLERESCYTYLCSLASTSLIIAVMFAPDWENFDSLPNAMSLSERTVTDFRCLETLFDSFYTTYLWLDSEGSNLVSDTIDYYKLISDANSIFISFSPFSLCIFWEIAWSLITASTWYASSYCRITGDKVAF